MSEGVTVKQLESTYFWSPVGTTEFSIGVVIPVSYEREALRTLPIPEGNRNFIPLLLNVFHDNTLYVLFKATVFRIAVAVTSNFLFTFQ